MTATPLASARDLSVTFAMGRKDVLALDNVSLDVAAGEILLSYSFCHMRFIREEHCSREIILSAIIRDWLFYFVLITQCNARGMI